MVLDLITWCRQHHLDLEARAYVKTCVKLLTKIQSAWASPVGVDDAVLKFLDSWWGAGFSFKPLADWLQVPENRTRFTTLVQLVGWSEYGALTDYVAESRTASYGTLDVRVPEPQP